MVISQGASILPIFAQTDKETPEWKNLSQNTICIWAWSVEVGIMSVNGLVPRCVVQKSSGEISLSSYKVSSVLRSLGWWQLLSQPQAHQHICTCQGWALRITRTPKILVHSLTSLTSLSIAISYGDP